jgi:hypothetical protein
LLLAPKVMLRYVQLALWLSLGRLLLAGGTAYSPFKKSLLAPLRFPGARSYQTTQAGGELFYPFGGPIEGDHFPLIPANRHDFHVGGGRDQGFLRNFDQLRQGQGSGSASCVHTGAFLIERPVELQDKVWRYERLEERSDQYLCWFKRGERK